MSLMERLGTALDRNIVAVVCNNPETKVAFAKMGEVYARCCEPAPYAEGWMDRLPEWHHSRGAISWCHPPRKGKSRGEEFARDLKMPNGSYKVWMKDEDGDFNYVGHYENHEEVADFLCR